MAFPPKKTAPPGDSSSSPEPSESSESASTASDSSSSESTDNALAMWAKKKRGEK